MPAEAERLTPGQKRALMAMSGSGRHLVWPFTFAYTVTIDDIDALLTAGLIEDAGQSPYPFFKDRTIRITPRGAQVKAALQSELSQ